MKCPLEEKLKKKKAQNPNYVEEKLPEKPKIKGINWKNESKVFKSFQ